MRFLCFCIAILIAGCLETDNARYRSQPIETPKVSDASVAAAARVNLVGRQLLAQNLFLGVEPIFHTFGQTEPEIDHFDEQGIFLSEGLVKRCTSDAELAAVLATEIAKMVAEYRTQNRNPAMPEPDRDVNAITREILKASGFDLKALDSVSPLLAEASQHRTLANRMQVRGRKPRWSN